MNEPERRSLDIKIMRELSLGLLALAFAVTVASAPAAVRTFAKHGAARNAAIHRCNVMARRLYPEQEWDIRQSDLYKACVSAAGFVP